MTPLRVALLFVLVTAPCACRSSAAISVEGGPTAAPLDSPVEAPPPDASSESRLVPDAELGPLIDRLSETAGDFPSDNYVSNETSVLDVAPALRSPALRGRAYVGVGPEQNYTYIATLEPQVAYVVDIRRGNLLEHMVLRGCFEEGTTRAAFLTALLARRAQPATGDFSALASAFAAAPADRGLRDAGVARTLALFERLHVRRAPHDEDTVARIHDAFFTRGLSLAYTMKNSGRKYPTIAETLAERDPEGAPGTFLASDELYARARSRVLENRVVPIVGDLGGEHTLRAIADDARARGLLLGAFYTSNVEQYLFDSKAYAAFVANVKAMPRDDASLIVRVWFDQGRPHPLQRKGERTTTLAAGANAFLAHADRKPFASYWEVVTTP